MQVSGKSQMLLLTTRGWRNNLCGYGDKKGNLALFWNAGGII